MHSFNPFRIIVFAFCFSGFTAVAQQADITGIITGDGNEPLTGAVAELRNAKDSTLAKVSVADLQGKYHLENVKAGEYFIKASILGYSPYFIEKFSFDGTKQKNMPAVKMQVSAVQLQSAEVTALRPLVEVKADKTVFNVENSINSTGSTAFELLQKAPGVVVDNNDNITLKGRGGVMVQIDGRQSRLSDQELADYLKNIQSTDVEAIELISNPSSKYDAEGTAGIINIRMKKNKNYGTSGSITAGYAIGKYSKYNTALSLSSRSRDINVFGNYSNNWGDRFNDFFLYREQNPYIFDQSGIWKRGGMSHNYKAGIDYTLNKKHSIGFMTNGNLNNMDGTNTNRNYISDFATNTIDSVLKSDQTFKYHGYNFNFNANHHYTDTMEHDLTTDFDFGYFDGNRDAFIPNIYTLPDLVTPLSSTFFRSVTPTIIKIYTIKSDYSRNFLKGKLGAGYKVSIVNTDNTFNFYNIVDNIEIIDDTRSNHFVYKENIYAGYLNYSRTVNKFDFQAGVRMESTSSEGDLKSATSVDDKNVKRSYTDFFPSGGATFNMNKNNSMALVYSSRIDRPNYQDLNPFEFKLDELSFRKGNPFLNPQYSDKIELSHTYKYTTTLSVSYSHTSDFFAQIADTFPGGKSILKPQNLASEDVWSANLSLSRSPVKWYSVYLNTGVYNQAYHADFGDNKTINTSFFSFNLYAQNTIKLPYGFTFEISGWVNSGGVWGGSYRTDAQGSLDLGLQKKIFSEQGSFKFSYTDILHTAPWSSRNTYAGIVARVHGSWESQQFRASFTWRFGNKQMKSVRQRTSGSEQELKRIGGGD